jgi:hypothetical protein
VEELERFDIASQDAQDHDITLPGCPGLCPKTDAKVDIVLQQLGTDHKRSKRSLGGAQTVENDAIFGPIVGANLV